MTDSEFHTTCRLQLLLPIIEGGTCDECGKFSDKFGYHCLTHNGTCNGKHARHQTVVRAFHDLAIVSGMHPVIDTPIKCLGEKNGVLRPADLLVDGDNDVRMCLDITVVSPFLVAASRPLRLYQVKAKEVLDAKG
jgi:hypothetical protein